MTKAEATAKRMAAAHSPEARAKRAETMKRKKMAKLAEAGDETPRMHSIPLHAIPDAPKKKKPKRNKNAEAWAHANTNPMTRERAALEITRLVMWLADPKNA